MGLLDDMTPDEEAEFDEFALRFRTDVLHQLVGSALGISIVPTKGLGDVKYWVELGAMICHDKPIMAIVTPGAHVPDKLRLVADELIEADPATPEGRELVAEALARIMKRFPHDQE